MDSGSYLRHGIELHHGGGQGLGEGAEGRDETQHGPVEGAVDLGEGGGAWVVHVHHGDMTQEPGRERGKITVTPELKTSLSSI